MSTTADTTVRTPDEILEPVSPARSFFLKLLAVVWVALAGAVATFVADHSVEISLILSSYLPAWATGVVAAALTALVKWLNARRDEQHKQEVLEALKTEPPKEIQRHY